MSNPSKPNSTTSKEQLLARAKAQTKRDKTRLILMCVGLVVVILGYLASTWQEKKHEAQQDAVVEQEEEFIEIQDVQKFDFASLTAPILDKRPEDRVLLPSALTEPITNYLFGFNDAHFSGLGVKLLTGEVRAALGTAPAEHRGDPLRARGWLEKISSRVRLDGKTEYRGFLRDTEGQAIHFIAMETPGEIIFGDFMRLDGLFVKLFRAEDNQGVWNEGPLLIGSQLVKSYAPLDSDSIDENVLRGRLSMLTDDTSKNTTGLNSPVFDAQWFIMDYANSAAYAAIDWDKDAVELNNESMTEILKHGRDWRFRLAADNIEDPRAPRDPETGQRPLLTENLIPIPMRIPVCKNMGVRTTSPGENPLRLDKITTGWLGNWQWTNHAGVIKFVMAGGRPDLTDRVAAELVQGKGFFLKNHNYESKDHGTRTAPYFVITELEVFHPIEDNLAQNIMTGVLILTLFLVVLFPLLLMRDRKKSDALHRDLVRRKQERRRRTSAEQPQA